MSNAKDSSHNHAHLSDNRGHPVIDSLEQTRVAHHQEPFPHSHDDAAAHIAHDDVVDEILNQEERVPLDPKNLAVNPPPASSSLSSPSHSSSLPDHNRRSSTAGSDYKGKGDSSNRRKSTDGGGASDNNGKGRPSAHSSSKAPSTPSSRSDGSRPDSNSAGAPVSAGNNRAKKSSHGTSGEQPRDDGGDMIGLSTTATLPSATWQPLVNKSSNQLPFKDAVHSGFTSSGHEFEHDKHSVLPEIMPGFKGRMADIHHSTLKSVSGVSGSSEVQGGSSDSSEGAQPWSGGTMFPTMVPVGFKAPFSGSTHREHTRSASEDATRALARSSILYESSDLTESTTRLDDDDESSTAHAGASVRHSDTLVEGGRGGRRWSHELSPEKAGLAGSVIEAAGLIKDVVMDRIQQRPPSKTTAGSSEKEAAARVAFGGAEEAGDQNIYLEGLDRHMAHDAARSAAADASTGAMDAQKVFGPALDAGLAGRSVFHQTANPEVMKSLLLNHPEALGYHARDPTLDPFEEQGANNTIAGNVPGPKDLSRMRR